jgi:hypothetical protein
MNAYYEENWDIAWQLIQKAHRIHEQRFGLHHAYTESLRQNLLTIEQRIVEVIWSPVGIAQILQLADQAETAVEEMVDHGSNVQRAALVIDKADPAIKGLERKVAKVVALVCPESRRNRADRCRSGHWLCTCQGSAAPQERLPPELVRQRLLGCGSSGCSRSALITETCPRQARPRGRGGSPLPGRPPGAC